MEEPKTAHPDGYLKEYFFGFIDDDSLFRRLLFGWQFVPINE